MTARTPRAVLIISWVDTRTIQAPSPRTVNRNLAGVKRLHPRHGVGMLARAIVIRGRDIQLRAGCRAWRGYEPRHAGDVRHEPRQRGMRRDKAGDPRMPHQEARHSAAWRLLRLACCNFQEPARGVLQKPRASYFPSVGGGGPSLRFSSRSNSSCFCRSCSSSALRRLASW